MDSQLPKLSHVLETVLYTKNIDKAIHFYGTILGLEPIPGMKGYPRGQGYQLGHTHLLIFALGKTTEDLILDPAKADKIPKHGPSEDVLETLLDESKVPPDLLRQHYCLATQTVEDAKKWEQYLIEQQVPITGEMNWEKGGYSVYFTDPDGHVGEVASRGLWPNW
jgi:catechol 2,3-dioxygenase-like lactoylglutathione lyase family enzyme